MTFPGFGGSIGTTDVNLSEGFLRKSVNSVNSMPQSIDTDLLVIIELIKKRFQTLSMEVGPIGNIFTIFMHDLVVHFSGILMHRAALERYPDEVKFPWVNKNYALLPYTTDIHTNGRLNLANQLKSSLRRLPLSRVALGSALPFGYRQEWFAAKAINLLASYKPFVQAYLPQRNQQIDGLLDFVIDLCRLHGIPRVETVRENWQQYCAFHTSDEQPVFREHGILLGTRNNLENRKLAVNYLQQGKEVIAITHGEVANSVMDEPPFGYSERTLCTTLIDFGDFDCDGEYNAPLISPRQRFYRSAPVARSIHRPCDDIQLPNRQYCRALYIPTTYTGNGLYGPFHIYEDALYRRWQQALFGTFPGLTLKAHPKSRSQPPADIRVERRQLEACILDYELLVFDYFATGSMLALMSDKPVIYFDIGLRRLHPNFIKDLKSRCEYAKIDLAHNMEEQVRVALVCIRSAGVVRSNLAMAHYALCERPSFNWLELFSAAASGTPPSWH